MKQLTNNGYEEIYPKTTVEVIAGYDGYQIGDYLQTLRELDENWIKLDQEKTISFDNYPKLTQIANINNIMGALVGTIGRQASFFVNNYYIMSFDRGIQYAPISDITNIQTVEIFNQWSNRHLTINNIKYINNQYILVGYYRIDSDYYAPVIYYSDTINGPYSLVTDTLFQQGSTAGPQVFDIFYKDGNYIIGINVKETPDYSSPIYLGYAYANSLTGTWNFIKRQGRTNIPSRGWIGDFQYINGKYIGSSCYVNSSHTDYFIVSFNTVGESMTYTQVHIDSSGNRYEYKPRKIKYLNGRIFFCRHVEGNGSSIQATIWEYKNSSYCEILMSFPNFNTKVFDIIYKNNKYYILIGQQIYSTKDFINFTKNQLNSSTDTYWQYGYIQNLTPVNGFIENNSKLIGINSNSNTSYPCLYCYDDTRASFAAKEGYYIKRK